MSICYRSRSPRSSMAATMGDRSLASEGWERIGGMPPAAAPTAAPPSILDVGADQPGEGLRGLLVSLLTIFDRDHSRTLTKEQFSQAAEPLGFDTSDEAWLALCGRFGDKTSKQRPTTAEGIIDTALDLSLLGEYFSNKYDPLLEDILRRVVRGVATTWTHACNVDRRLRVVEEHLENTSMRDVRERELKINRTLRRWKHKYTAPVFDGWKGLVQHNKELINRTMRHWANQTISGVWRRWVDMIAEIKEQRHSVTRTIAKWRMRFVSLTFECWAAATKEAVDHREHVMTRAAAAFGNKELFTAFLLWREDAERVRPFFL